LTFGQQFHQQNEQSPLTSNYSTYSVGNPGHGLRRANKCGRVKMVNGILPSSW